MIGQIVRFPQGKKYEDGTQVLTDWIGVVTSVYDTIEGEWFSVWFPNGYYTDVDAYSFPVTDFTPL